MHLFLTKVLSPSDGNLVRPNFFRHPQQGVVCLSQVPLNKFPSPQRRSCLILPEFFCVHGPILAKTSFVGWLERRQNSS